MSNVHKRIEPGDIQGLFLYHFPNQRCDSAKQFFAVIFDQILPWILFKAVPYKLYKLRQLFDFKVT